MWKKVLFGAAAVLLLIGIAVGAKYYTYIQTKTIGIMMEPKSDHTLAAVPFYLQKDPAWAGDMIGGSKTTMGASGCLVSCLASALCGMGTEVTPGELNEKLTAAGAFEDANLLWYRVHEVFSEVDYEYSRTFTADTIETYLADGLFPVVKVKMHGKGATHWVLIIGASDGDFLVMDPLNTNEQPLPLSTHGNVYAFRVLVPAKGY